MNKLFFILFCCFSLPLFGQVDPEQIYQAPGRDYFLLSTDTLNSNYPINGIYVPTKLDTLFLIDFGGDSTVAVTWQNIININYSSSNQVLSHVIDGSIDSIFLSDGGGLVVLHDSATAYEHPKYTPYRMLYTMDDSLPAVNGSWSEILLYRQSERFQQHSYVTKNVGLGQNAGGASWGGFGNVAIGYNALSTHTSNNYNVAIGAGAGGVLTSGYNNVFIGVSSGGLHTNGFSNTHIGSYTGANNSTGYGNIYIGSYAGANSTGVNEILIGNSSRTGTEEEIFYAHQESDSSAFRSTLTIRDIPQYESDSVLVVGENHEVSRWAIDDLLIEHDSMGLVVTDDHIVFGDGTRAPDFALDFVYTSTGLGVGTATPAHEVHIDGGVATEVALEFDDTLGGYGEFQFKQNGATSWSIGQLNRSGLDSNSMYVYQYRDRTGSTVNQYRMKIRDDGQMQYNAYTGSNFAQAAPYFLVIDGSGLITKMDTTGWGGGGGSGSPDSDWYKYGTATAGTNTDTIIHGTVSINEGFMTIGSDSIPDYTLNLDGGGTTTRIDIDHVDNSGVQFSHSGDRKFVNNVFQSDYLVYNYQTSETAFFIEGTNNRVGIGTSTPSSQFHVYDNTSGAASSDIIFDKDNAFVYDYVNITTGSNTDGIRIYPTGTYDANTSALQFWDNASGFAGIFMDVGSTGSFYVRHSVGAQVDMTIKSTGQMQLNQYTGTNFDQAPLYYLGVDGSGNVIKYDSSNVGSGGGLVDTYIDDMTFVSNDLKIRRWNGTSWVDSITVNIPDDADWHVMGTNDTPLIIDSSIWTRGFVTIGDSTRRNALALYTNENAAFGIYNAGDGGVTNIAFYDQDEEYSWNLGLTAGGNGIGEIPGFHIYKEGASTANFVITKNAGNNTQFVIDSNFIRVNDYGSGNLQESYTYIAAYNSGGKLVEIHPDSIANGTHPEGYIWGQTVDGIKIFAHPDDYYASDSTARGINISGTDLLVQADSYVDANGIYQVTISSSNIRLWDYDINKGGLVINKSTDGVTDTYEFLNESSWMLAVDGTDIDTIWANHKDYDTDEGAYTQETPFGLDLYSGEGIILADSGIVNDRQRIAIHADLSIVSDADHYQIGTTGAPTDITQDIWTDGKVRIGQDSLSDLFGSSSAVLLVTGGIVPAVFQSSNATNNTISQTTTGGDRANYIIQGGSYRIDVGDSPTSGNTYLQFDIGYAGDSILLLINDQGDVLLPEYGTGTHTGVAAYNIQMTSDGQLITTSTAGGGGADSDWYIKGTSTAAGQADTAYHEAEVWINDDLIISGLTAYDPAITIDNRNYIYSKTNTGTTVRMLGIESDNDVQIGAITNSGGRVELYEDGVIRSVWNNFEYYSLTNDHYFGRYQGGNIDLIIGHDRTTDGPTWIDFHSDTDNVFDGRLIRWTGTTGALQLQQREWGGVLQINHGINADIQIGADTIQLPQYATGHTSGTLQNLLGLNEYETIINVNPLSLPFDDYGGWSFSTASGFEYIRSYNPTQPFDEVYFQGSSGINVTHTSSTLGNQTVHTVNFAASGLDNYSYWSLSDGTDGASITSAKTLQIIGIGGIVTNITSAGNPAQIVIDGSGIVAPGDNWGSQVAATTSPIGGNGTGGSPIGIISNSIGAIHIAEDAIGHSEIAPGVVRSTEILNGTVAEVDMNISNSPFINGVLTYTGTNTMSWTNATSQWTDPGQYIHPTETADKVLVGTSDNALAVEEFTVHGQYTGVDINSYGTSQNTFNSFINFKNTLKTESSGLLARVKAWRKNGNEGVLTLSYYEGVGESYFLSGGSSSSSLFGGGTHLGGEDVYIGSGGLGGSDELYVQSSSGAARIGHENTQGDNWIIFESDGDIELKTWSTNHSGHIANLAGTYFSVNVDSGSEIYTNTSGTTLRSGTVLHNATNQLALNGNASKSVAGSWNANSDKRLKKDIVQLDSREMLKRLLRLKGVSFEWDDDKTGFERPEGTQIGFIAQDIEKAFNTTQFVSKDDHGYLVSAYGTYDPVIVEAIRALNDKVEENEKLKETVNELERRLDRLEKMIISQKQN